MRQGKFAIASAAVLFSLLSLPHDGRPQSQPIRPVTLGQGMPDFTLPVYQGGELRLSSLRGKTLLIVFPRGLAGQDHWCHVCNYQHSELVDAEMNQQIRKKNNLEIIYVFPYNREMITQWIDAYRAQLADIENYKNPPKEQLGDEKIRQRMERTKKEMPRSFHVSKGKVPTPFPILIDADRVVSKGLGIFAEEWSGSKVDQDIPTVFVVDPAGIVRFKYISQNTFDRPGLSYLLKMIEWANTAKPAIP